ncbi:CD209 antigen-like protein E [Branchiostoma floridae]|uniref:CD209 antigen-like protein E n=1 Tax=Branchiostoma floridae TaxID=7739 RepID=A0A9J7NCR9_BRAFL|nr:CD209 antigen-like protein E [Branchiostoma floridae]
MTTAAFAMASPAPSVDPPAPPEVAPAPLDVATASPEGIGKSEVVGISAPKDDSCGTGYKLVGGALIRLAKEIQSHHYAMAACKEEGATLAMPKTEELDVALRNLVKTEGGNKDHWIGLEERGETCSWYWVDGSKVDSNQYKGWYPDQPSNPRYFGCLVTWCGQYWSGDTASHDPMWDDTDCWRQKSFICQC